MRTPLSLLGASPWKTCVCVSRIDYMCRYITYIHIYMLYYILLYPHLKHDDRSVVCCPFSYTDVITQSYPCNRSCPQQATLPTRGDECPGHLMFTCAYCMMLYMVGFISVYGKREKEPNLTRLWILKISSTYDPTTCLSQPKRNPEHDGKQLKCKFI